MRRRRPPDETLGRPPHQYTVPLRRTGHIPLNMVQKWLGHAQLTTTAIYANAVGVEEQDIASRMWN